MIKTERQVRMILSKNGYALHKSRAKNPSPKFVNSESFGSGVAFTNFISKCDVAVNETGFTDRINVFE